MKLLSLIKDTVLYLGKKIILLFSTQFIILLQLSLYSKGFKGEIIILFSTLKEQKITPFHDSPIPLESLSSLSNAIESFVKVNSVSEKLLSDF